jgi:hypothetical protein
LKGAFVQRVEAAEGGSARASNAKESPSGDHNLQLLPQRERKSKTHFEDETLRRHSQSITRQNAGPVIGVLNATAEAAVDRI